MAFSFEVAVGMNGSDNIGGWNGNDNGLSAYYVVDVDLLSKYRAIKLSMKATSSVRESSIYLR